MFNMAVQPKPEDPVVIFSNGGFGLNPGNVKVSQNILKSLREFEKIKTESEKSSCVETKEQDKEIIK